CYLVLMSGLLLDQSLLIGIHLLLAAIANVGFLYALEEGFWLKSHWKKNLRRPLGIFFRAVPLIGLIFILFPRFSTGFGASSTVKAKTGINDRLRPESVSSLSPSDELIFRATFYGGFIPA